jgi:PAS domain S-box-containing protein
MPMDIYSLGVLTYEMLTGQLPFRGNVPQVMEAHVRQAPRPVSLLLKEPLDERAEAFVMKALAKEPEQRQRDMTALIYELRTLMDMLGFGRRRGVTSQARAVTVREDRRAAASRAAFESSPLPMAGVDVDGTIVVANRAFAQFLTGQSDSAVEGVDIGQTRMVDVHPELAADMRAAHAQGVKVNRMLRLKTQDGSRVNLMLWIVPGVSDAGEVHLTVHSLDTPPPK